MSPTDKRCTGCGETKPITEFALRRRRDPNKLGGYAERCTPCMRAYKAEGMRALRSRDGDKERRRRYHLKSTYNLTMEEYRHRLEAQGGVCAVCGEPETVNAGWDDLAVDHDHACCRGHKSCGRCVRGLLCRRCNHVLGQVKDDVRLLVKLITYVEERGLSPLRAARALEKVWEEPPYLETNPARLAKVVDGFDWG